MIGEPAIWGLGLVGSVALHAVCGGILLWSFEPKVVYEQSMPETKMHLSTYQVERSDAAEAVPERQTAATSNTTGRRIGQGTIPQTRGKSLAPDFAALQPVPKRGQKATQASVRPTVGQSEIIDATQISAAVPKATTLVAGDASDIGDMVQTRPPSSNAISLDQPLPVSAKIEKPQTTTLSTAPLPETVMVAALAFSGSGDVTVDPVSIAAFQSFVDPSNAGSASTELRDGISGVLSRVPCSRIQVQFHPENNTLEVVGHVPEYNMQAPIIAALQAQMGQSISVTDNLLILPRPQCGALSGIGDVGLPQSTDQIINPLIVGADAHAREFNYSEGQQLVLDLTAPDYDAYVYVDYYDADGMVIHLSPNENVDLVKTPAKSVLKIGAEKLGDPGLFITIGPPFGQEIAAAFATSEPLYDGIRPLGEPAEDYLEWLKERVSALRAENSDFKGEWVYFFIATSPN